MLCRIALTLLVAALSVLASQARAQVVRFSSPMINGAVVDNCASWGTDCGRGGAEQFCRQQGLGAALSWQLNNPGRTWVIGSNRHCEGGGCVGFSQVECAASGPAVARFMPPLVNGVIADNCESWATNCGRGGADLFCRQQGLGAATGWSLNRPGRTWVIGSNRACEGGNCVGFSHVDCVIAAPMPADGRRRFQPPLVNGVVADNCAAWATNCGKGGADLFCQQQGYAQALQWELNRPGRTWVIGSNRACDGGGCVGFSYVDCGGAKPAPPPPPPQQGVSGCDADCARECRARGFQGGTFGGICLLGVKSEGTCNCR
jgi:hypothetical protein